MRATVYTYRSPKGSLGGGLRGISRALKANCHDAAVCVLEDTAGDEIRYIEVYPKGVFDCSYPTSKLRRGRVIQGGAVSNRRLLFGLSRTRNNAGWIEHFNLRDVTNTIHAQVGAARLNMEVLIAEFYESDITPSEE